MAKRTWTSLLTKSMKRSLATLRRSALRSALRPASPAARRVLKAMAPKAVVPALVRRTPAPVQPVPGQWLPGVALGPSGARRYWMYCPADLRPDERVPLLVMLHGCGQDAASFAASTRMNRIAARERFLVLYPEQEQLANAQGCWNWFHTRSGRAYGEVELIMAAIDQVCARYPVDGARIAMAGLSAGASMAALVAIRHPARFRAVAMHSGVPPGAAYSTMTALGAMRGRRTVTPLSVARILPDADLPPLLVIHGRDDTVVAIGNGEAAARAWADAAEAQPGRPRQVQRGRRHAMTVTDFKRRGRVAATLVDIEDLGHAWSGGAASEPYGDRAGPDASRMVWAFAARQFRG